MTVIIGEIDCTMDRCSCSHMDTGHDAYGCIDAGCECMQTSSQLSALRSIRESLSVFTTRVRRDLEA